ncbi:MAG TPA: TetR/AcrR family transcriptional regulator [bacterium]|nr:TetR/AcrR family transcriptional regulator [bacterium]HNS34243.1 TetR/AcrR family transcriptional regulator [bacterium]HNW09636.1 TetR/AcrR family transcriptional regulator [bacterium]HNZ73310.1 TetR/AcrR family transcriptional regulator [bacterium]HOH67413.1 TetR/AcrR family transcriptional regulator [bacterium]
MKTIANQSEDIIHDHDTKKYVIDTARHLFSDFSYLGVSMNDIAKKLNITKAALYYHFTGKKEIYEKVLDNVFNDLSLSITQASNEATIDKKLHKLIKNYLDFGFKEKNLIKALILKSSPADDQIIKRVTQLRERIANLIQPVIKEVFISKKLAEKIDVGLLISLLTGMIDGLLLEYSFLNKKINSAKISDQIIAVLF